jgi:hypothetical protein
LDTLKGCVDALIDNTSSASLFPHPPVLSFRPAQTICPNCHSCLKVLKTREKSATTLHIGKFIAHQTLLYCNRCDCQTVYEPDELTKLVPDHCTFGYDVMVYTGKALFLRHRNTKEIIDELANQNILISAGEIDYLGKKFIAYLAVAHRQCAERIKSAMQLKGGYVLHLDSTCQDKDPLLMTGLDSIMEIVLGNVKLPSEKAEKIIPFLQQIISRFGTPVAVVHDMGQGICKAVKNLLPATPDFICHFHFLRDIGKDLFENEYATLRNRLKKHGITLKLRQRARSLKKILDENHRLVTTLYQRIQNPANTTSPIDQLFPSVIAYSLIQWILDGKQQGHGYGFPFDQPHLIFAQRLTTAYTKINQLKNSPYSPSLKINKRPFFKLSDDLEPIVKDITLKHALADIEPKIKIFNTLRKAMRIAPQSGTQGLNCDGSDTNIQTIEKKVKIFYHTLCNHKDFSKNSDYQKLIAQLDKYWVKLFADPIVIHTAGGNITIQPQRTNNILERFFRNLKRGYRRKTGNNSIGKTLQAMLADTPLVKNLENSKYVSILLNGKSCLEEVFAHMDKKTVLTELHSVQKSPEKVPPKIKKIIANPMFHELISNILN